MNHPSVATPLVPGGQDKWAGVAAAAIFEPGRGHFRVRRPAPARSRFRCPRYPGLPGRLDPQGQQSSLPSVPTSLLSLLNRPVPPPAGGALGPFWKLDPKFRSLSPSVGMFVELMSSSSVLSTSHDAGGGVGVGVRGVRVILSPVHCLW